MQMYISLGTVCHFIQLCRQESS